MFHQSIFARSGAKLQLEAKGQESGGTWWLWGALCPCMAVSCQSVLFQKSWGTWGQKRKKLLSDQNLIKCLAAIVQVWIANNAEQLYGPSREKCEWMHNKRKTNASEVFCLVISGMFSICILQLRRTGVEMWINITTWTSLGSEV